MQNGTAQQHESEVVDGQFGDKIQVSESGPLTRLGGEVDVQIATAKQYPRSIKAFKDQAMQMATFDEATAAGCFYSLPRGGKPIEGPSARLAEIVLSAWGNVRADAKVVAVEDKEIVAEAMTWDLEKNVAIRVQVRRRITGKNGQRFNDDMITVTGNAACAIALRNSVFKVIPNVFTNAIYHAARKAAIGDIQTIAAKRAEMVAYFGKMGVTPDRVFAAVGKSNVEEIGLDELATLKGVATAIKDNEFSVDEAFPPIQANGSASSGVAGMKERMEEKKAAAEPQASGSGDEPNSEFDSAKSGSDNASDETSAADAKLTRKSEQVEWLEAYAAGSDEQAEQLAKMTDGAELNALSAKAVNEIYLEISK